LGSRPTWVGDSKSIAWGLSIHTARYNITRVVYIESHDTAPDAIEREKQIKRWRREKKIALIEAANPEWLDLSSEVL